MYMAQVCATLSGRIWEDRHVTPGGMPKPSDRAKADFASLLPDEPSVAARPMFGNLAAFVNGNMFSGLFGEDLFVRVSEADREDLIQAGGADFAPMAGRPMKGYVTLAPGWSDRPALTRQWIGRALEMTRALPAKAAKPKKVTKPAKR
jgi:TfoX/Sxy family transcriptional regulator of competence genes